MCAEDLRRKEHSPVDFIGGRYQYYEIATADDVTCDGNLGRCIRPFREQLVALLRHAGEVRLIVRIGTTP